MVRGLRDMRTMRDVWDERRKGLARRPGRPSIVRRLTPTPPATRRRPPKGTVPPRTWVFSKRPAAPSPDRQLLVKRTREPEVDLFDEEDELIVLADMPGVSDKDVRIRVEKDLLIIEAASTGAPAEVRYYTEALLPYEVDDHFSHSCRNGVLEVHLRPRRPAGGAARTTDERGSSVNARQAGKKKKPRRQKNESSQTEGKRKRKARARKGRGGES